MRKPLAGRVVVVTRPRGQAETLCQALLGKGARALLFPVIDIGPLKDTSELQQLTSQLANYHIAFFVSPNAVEHAFSVLGKVPWPTGLNVAAVGPSTAQALRAQGFTNVIVPTERFDSEAVLALPAFQSHAVQGKRILILRGDGGRDVLAETLLERGAHVDLVSCYHRRKADTDPTPLIALHALQKLDVLIFTSSEGVRYFSEIIGDDNLDMIAQVTCFVSHARIAEELISLGAQQVITTAAGDEGIVAALVQHFG